MSRKVCTLAPLWILTLAIAVCAVLDAGRARALAPSMALDYAVRLNPVRDTWVDYWHPPDSWGPADYLRVGGNACAGVAYVTCGETYLYFDLSSIPRTAIITLGELHLRLIDASSRYPSDRTNMCISYAGGPWDDRITFYTKPPIGGTIRHAAIGTELEWCYLDIKVAIQAWVSGTVPNNGLHLWVDLPGGELPGCNQRVFGSKESIYKPELVIFYTLNTPTPTLIHSLTPTPTRTPPVLPRPSTSPGTTPNRTPTPHGHPARAQPALPAGDSEALN